MADQPGADGAKRDPGLCTAPLSANAPRRDAAEATSLDLVVRNDEAAALRRPFVVPRNRRRPTLPGLAPQVPSARAGLTSVRNGKRYFPVAMTAEVSRAALCRPEPALASPSKLHSNPTCSKSRPRAISTGQLNALLRLAPPAYRRGGLPRPLLTRSDGEPHLEVGFPLRCFQRLSHPDVANQQCPWQDN